MLHRDIVTNGIRLHVVEAGAADGRLVILLHGFPDFWYGWRYQLPALVDAGYRVWVPDQRGYNMSDKPRGIGSYTIDKLMADVLGLLDAAECERGVIVGHDWGGAVAWRLAMQCPHRVDRLVILNAPCPPVMARSLRIHPAQLLKSWYMFAFQLPWLPELLLRRNHWRWLFDAVRSSARAGAFTEEEFEPYRNAWSQPGAITAMVHWYRAAMQRRVRLIDDMRVLPKTLLLWGARDQALRPQLADESIGLCDQGKLIYFDEATHWVHREEADRVNTSILEFLNDALLL
jgi:pimeloyl-ACP methyl ester carboxylesterase